MVRVSYMVCAVMSLVVLYATFMSPQHERHRDSGGGGHGVYVEDVLTPMEIGTSPSSSCFTLPVILSSYASSTKCQHTARLVFTFGHQQVTVSEKVRNVTVNATSGVGWGVAWDGEKKGVWTEWPGEARALLRALFSVGADITDLASGRKVCPPVKGFVRCPSEIEVGLTPAKGHKEGPNGKTECRVAVALAGPVRSTASTYYSIMENILGVVGSTTTTTTEFLTTPFFYVVD